MITRGRARTDFPVDPTPSSHKEHTLDDGGARSIQTVAIVLCLAGSGERDCGIGLKRVG